MNYQGSGDLRTRVFPIFFGKSGLEDPRFNDWLLVKNFRELGVDFLPLHEADEIWFFDFSLTNLKLLFAKELRSKRKALFIMEPRAVNPLTYSKIIRMAFDLVISTDSNASGLDHLSAPERLNVPYRGHLSNPDGTLFWQQSKQIASVGVAFGDKQSLGPTSLYWLRRDFLRRLSREGFVCHVAGPGWDAPAAERLKQILQSFFAQLTSAKLPMLQYIRPSRLTRSGKPHNLRFEGWVDVESDFYSRNQTVVVIENDRLFHSEKIYAALATNSFVIYVGPNGEKFKALENVISCEPNVDSLIRSVRIATAASNQDGKFLMRKDFLKTNNLEDFYSELAGHVVRHVQRSQV